MGEFSIQEVGKKGQFNKTKEKLARKMLGIFKSHFGIGYGQAFVPSSNPSDANNAKRKPQGFADFAATQSQDTYEPAAKRSRASTSTSGSYMPPPPPLPSSISPQDAITPCQPHLGPREGQSQESSGITSGKDPLELIYRYHKEGKAVGPNSWIFEGKGSFSIFLLKVYLIDWQRQGHCC